MFSGQNLRVDDEHPFAVSADGRRFLVTNAEPSPTEFVIVQHWFEELKRLVQ